MAIADLVRLRNPLSVAVALAAATVLAGCAIYTPTGLGGMSAADICELLDRQGWNISPQGRQAIQSELSRRNDNCANHAAEVAERYAHFMYREVYGKGDSPP